jgi:hypothetical protein
MVEKEILGYFLERNVVFTILENVVREIFFPDIINERIKELADEQGKEMPKLPKADFESFLRIPILDEYLVHRII